MTTDHRGPHKRSPAVDPPTPSSGPIEAAARLLAAQHDHGRKAYADHVETPNGTCAVCTVNGARVVHWPCTMAFIGQRVAELARQRSPHRENETFGGRSC